MGEEARVTVIATGFDESFLQATPSVERRVAEAMRGGRMVANGGNNGGYRAPSGGNGMVSGVGSLVTTTSQHFLRTLTKRTNGTARRPASPAGLLFCRLCPMLQLSNVFFFPRW